MESSRFNRVFTRLVGAFKRYHDAPRSPDGIPRLARARQDLDEARGAMADERARLRHGAGPAPRPVRKFAVADDRLAELRVTRLTDSNRGS